MTLWWQWWADNGNDWADKMWDVINWDKFDLGKNLDLETQSCIIEQLYAISQGLAERPS